MEVTEIATYGDFARHREGTVAEQKRRQDIEHELLSDEQAFRIPGHCYVCRKPSKFLVDYTYASEVDGLRIPNWRERLICDGCGLNNRLRASLHLFDRSCSPKKNDRIYITEQTTPIYRWLLKHYPNVTGSEYLADKVPPGAKDANGIRNESLTRLSFPDDHFDHILSFDVLEHIPKVEKALSECQRCLKPGGNLLFSVPFLVNARETLTRARVAENGEIEHLLPAEYHGDPLTTDGCLCFYHFGWDLMEKLRDAGFASAQALLYWSRELGYLGGEQILLFGRK
jgi:SAM-dependent methyltransferase